MKSSGGIRPRSGSRQRRRASAAAGPVVGQGEDRLEVQLELVPVEGAVQARGHHQPLERLARRTRVEAVARAALVARLVHRGLRVA
jgi:hypothetical protein